MEEAQSLSCFQIKRVASGPYAYEVIAKCQGKDEPLFRTLSAIKGCGRAFLAPGDLTEGHFAWVIEEDKLKRLLKEVIRHAQATSNVELEWRAGEYENVYVKSQGYRAKALWSKLGCLAKATRSVVVASGCRISSQGKALLARASGAKRSARHVIKRWR